MVGGKAAAERGNEGLEGAPTLSLDWLAFLVDRPPITELFDVLQEHQARPGCVRPADHHPGQPANPAVTRCASLGLAMVAAVGRGPEDSDRLAAGGVDRIHLKHVGDIVCSLRVVGAVNRQRDRVVVYRDIRLPVRPGNPGAGATSAGEQVHHQFLFEWQAHAWLTVNELGQFLLSGHRGSSPAGVIR
ncbi:hypothetical protein D3C81_1153030 [compost metagenome]